MITELAQLRETGARPVATIAELRLRSQLRSRHRLRAHALRAVIRFPILLAIDLAVTVAVIALFSAIRSIDWQLAATAPPFPEVGRLLLAVTIGLLAFGSYRQGDPWRSGSTVYQGVAVGVSLVFWHQLWGPAPGLVVAWGIALFLLLGTGLSVGRWASSWVLARVRERFRFQEPVIILGEAEAVEAAMASSLFDNGSGFRFTDKIVIDPEAGYDQALAPLLERLALGDTATLVVPGYLSAELWTRIIEITDAGGCRLLSMAERTGTALTTIRRVAHRGVPLTQVTTPHLRFHQLTLKRATDLLIASTVLVILAPLMLAIAILVKVTSPGPVLFRQERVGLGGRRFQILKFRSMRQDAEGMVDALIEQSVYDDQKLFKVPDDPRITRLGSFLRRTSLDELPQLVNVVLGDMSLVGPRPPLPREVVLYEAHHYCRFDVKPGITGPWQVSGRNEITDFETVILLERDYIRNWGLVRDFRILLQTIPVVLGRRGAV